MKVQPTAVTEHYLACPSCGKGRFIVGHMLAMARQPGMTRHFGPWYCDDCGRGFSGDVCDDGSIDVQMEATQLARLSVRLEIPPSAEPYVLEVEDTMPVDDGDDDDPEPDGLRYLYEEHLDVSDVLRRVERVSWPGFRFVSAVVERRMPPDPA